MNVTRIVLGRDVIRQTSMEGCAAMMPTKMVMQEGVIRMILTSAFVMAETALSKIATFAIAPGADAIKPGAKNLTAKSLIIVTAIATP
jgi:hypothetical protein